MEYNGFKLKINAQKEHRYFKIVKNDSEYDIIRSDEEGDALGILPVISPSHYGDKGFRDTYNTKYSYYAGSMAHGISSEEMVIALGKKGFLGSFGTGGLSIDRVSEAIDHIRNQLGDGPYMFNVLAGNNGSDNEKRIIDLFIEKRVRNIEVSAFVSADEHIAYFRLSGLSVSDKDGIVKCENHIIAKVSREEVARVFMKPVPQNIVDKLLAEGKITEKQAELSQLVPLADDITVEGDSGGHTDNRALISLLPAIISIRDHEQQDYNYKTRIGAAGGIGTPHSVLAAFKMGAAYVVTGSINQSCIESGTSEYVKNILSETKMADVIMSPSADMFEQGGKVEVLKRKKLFAQNANFLYEVYCRYNSIKELSPSELKRIETRILKDTIENIWNEVCKYFSAVNPDKLELANRNEKFKMALIFRWYLGKSVKWALNADIDRKTDMQIWCGQSMGAFNSWIQCEFPEVDKNRKVADIALLLMQEAALKDMYQIYLQEIDQIAI